MSAVSAVCAVSTVSMYGFYMLFTASYAISLGYKRYNYRPFYAISDFARPYRLDPLLLKLLLKFINNY